MNSASSTLHTQRILETNPGQPGAWGTHSPENTGPPGVPGQVPRVPRSHSSRRAQAQVSGPGVGHPLLLPPPAPRIQAPVPLCPSIPTVSSGAYTAGATFEQGNMCHDLASPQAFPRQGHRQPPAASLHPERYRTTPPPPAMSALLHTCTAHCHGSPELRLTAA